MNKSFILGVFLLLLLPLTFAFEPIVLEEGEITDILVGNNNYHVEVLIIEDTNPPAATFKINGDITPQMEQTDAYQLQEALFIVKRIFLNEGGEAGSGDTVRITFTQYCGDNSCDEAETCGGCNDCACQAGYFCQGGDTCREYYCGDGICSDNEDCPADDCCDGESISDFGTDNDNCGACDNKCGKYEKCTLGVCRTQMVCGDNICSNGEKETCEKDCKIFSPKPEIPKQIEQKKEETPVSNNVIITSFEQKGEKVIIDKKTGIVEKFFFWLTHIF